MTEVGLGQTGIQTDRQTTGHTDRQTAQSNSEESTHTVAKSNSKENTHTVAMSNREEATHTKVLSPLVPTLYIGRTLETMTLSTIRSHRYHLFNHSTFSKSIQSL